MASSGEKSLAVGHISGFQIDPRYGKAAPAACFFETAEGGEIPWGML